MGLGSFLKRSVSDIGGVGWQFLSGSGSLGGSGLFDSLPGVGMIDDLTGKSGAEAALYAADLQAKQFQKLYDLYKPIVEAGQQQLGPLAQSATVQGFGNNIGDILNSDSFSALRDQRQKTATQQLSQAGLRRSGYAGKAAANIDTDLALQIESELNRRRQAILSGGQTGINGAGGALQGIGSSLAGGQLGAAQSNAQGSQNLMAIGGALLAAFSDPRLKKNAKKIGKIGKANVYQWTWNELANECGLSGESVGLMANEIKELHPATVINIGGFDMIDYPAAIQELKNAA